MKASDDEAEAEEVPKKKAAPKKKPTKAAAKVCRYLHFVFVPSNLCPQAEESAPEEEASDDAPKKRKVSSHFRRTLLNADDPSFRNPHPRQRQRSLLPRRPRPLPRRRLLRKMLRK